MTSLLADNIKMALHSLRSSKLRSSLTMLGIVIGVSSVICAVSLGEGIRRQVETNIETIGNDVMIVRSGNLVRRDNKGDIQSVNYLSALNANTLTDFDLQTVSKIADVKAVVPLSNVSALPATREGRKYEGLVLATTPEFSTVLHQQIAYGSFFGPGQASRPVAVIGQNVAQELFRENVPIGDIIVIRGQEFIVSGIFDTFNSDVLSGGGNLNRAVFIPYQTAKVVAGNNMTLTQMFVKTDPKAVESVAGNITKKLAENHGGLTDFTVLKPGESLVVATKTLNVATAFVAGIAAISLIVGGIGIMNIMFVGVIERTREIGIRKSLGATNKQIRSQFLIESAIISLVGGIIGIIVALLSNFLMRVFSNLKPVTTLPIIFIAVLASIAVGIVFGTAPAIKAARRDPIEALRYE